VDFAERGSFDKTMEGFKAKREFAEGERLFSFETALFEAGEVSLFEIIGAVDDAEVFSSPALHGGLNEPPRTLDEEVLGLHDHALAPVRGEFFPPMDGLVHRHEVVEIDDLGSGGLKEGWVYFRETRVEVHVPGVGLFGVDLRFRREEVEGSDLVVVNRRRFPAIGAIGFAELTDVFFLGREALGQACEVGVVGVFDEFVRGRVVEFSRCADGRVLAGEKVAGFRGPGHDFTIEAGPVGCVLFPKVDRIKGSSEAVEDGVVEFLTFEEGATGSRVDRAGATIVDAEAGAGRFLISDDDDVGTRAHVLFLAEDATLADALVVGEGFFGSLQPTYFRAGGTGRHGGREVDEPAGIDREATHYFERGDGVFFADGQVVEVAGVDDFVAGDVGEIEEGVEVLLGREAIGVGFEGLGRFGVGLESGGGNGFVFRVTESGEIAAKDATGVDVDGAIEPARIADRSVAIDDEGLATVVGGPVETHGETVFIFLAGGVSVEAHFANGPGAASDHFFFDSGVGHDEAALVEDKVGDEAVDEVAEIALVDGIFFKLRDGEIEAVSEGDFFAVEMAEELDVVVAGDAVGGACGDRVHDKAEDVGRVGATIDEVADEDKGALGMTRDIVFHLVAQLIEQSEEFGVASVDVADDVERAYDVLLVIPEWFASEAFDGLDFFDRIEGVNFAEALAL